MANEAVEALGNDQNTPGPACSHCISIFPVPPNSRLDDCKCDDCSQQRYPFYVKETRRAKPYP